MEIIKTICANYYAKESQQGILVVVVFFANIQMAYFQVDRLR